MSEECAPMDKEEMWNLMTTAPLLSHGDLEWLVSQYVDILQSVSQKLTEEELFSFLAVGTAFYQGSGLQNDAKELAAEALRRTGEH